VSVYEPPVIRDFTPRAVQLISQLDADRPETIDTFTSHMDASIAEGLCPVCARRLELLQGCPVCHSCQYDWSPDDSDPAGLWSRAERASWMGGWQRSLKRFLDRQGA
jgi:hypothetical protein